VIILIVEWIVMNYLVDLVLVSFMDYEHYEYEQWILDSWILDYTSFFGYLLSGVSLFYWWSLVTYGISVSNGVLYDYLSICFFVTFWVIFDWYEIRFELELVTIEHESELWVWVIEFHYDLR